MHIPAQLNYFPQNHCDYLTYQNFSTIIISKTIHPLCLFIINLPHSNRKYRPRSYKMSNRQHSFVSHHHNHSDVMTFLSIQKCILSLIGYDLRTAEPSNIRRIFTMLNLVLLVLILWPEWCAVRANSGDVRLLADSLAPLVTSLISVAKLITFSRRRAEFVALAGRLRCMWHESESELLNMLNISIAIYIMYQPAMHPKCCCCATHLWLTIDCRCRI